MPQINCRSPTLFGHAGGEEEGPKTYRLIKPELFYQRLGAFLQLPIYGSVMRSYFMFDKPWKDCIADQ